jgi:hypothetical protein
MEIPIVPLQVWDLPNWSEMRRAVMFRAALDLQKIEAKEEAVLELEEIYLAGPPLGKMDQACKCSKNPTLASMSWDWRLAIFHTAMMIQASAASLERTEQMYPRHAEGFPYLRISLILEDCKRSPHAWLDGFAAKWDDEVWKVLRPPFDWSCGCMVRMAARPVAMPEFEPAQPGMPRVPPDVLHAATGWMARYPRYLWDRKFIPKRPHVTPAPWPEDPLAFRSTEEERTLLRHYGISVSITHES